MLTILVRKTGVGYQGLTESKVMPLALVQVHSSMAHVETLLSCFENSNGACSGIFHGIEH